MNSSVIVAYIPVLHQGYLNFIERHYQKNKIKNIYLFTDEQTKQLRPLVKDIRAIESSKMLEPLRAAIKYLPNLNIGLLDESAIKTIKEQNNQIITPDDELLTPLVKDLFPDNKITTDNYFLRWDAKKSLSRSDVTPDEKVSFSDFDKKIMSKAQELAKKSSDWWRQVAAILVSPEGNILIADRNRHLPHDDQHYSDGDPRADFQSGVNIEASSSIHAESQVIAQAAKLGIATDGCLIYVTTFPCPVCAKLIAQSGIKTLYYQDGYSLVDGENVLKAADIEIVRVESPNHSA